MSRVKLPKVEVNTEIEINASSKKVWDVIADFQNYNRWNQTLKISGNSSIGDKLAVYIKLPGSKPKNIRYFIMNNVIEKKLEIKGLMIAYFLWKAENVFELIPIDENKTRFINKECFSGLLIPFMHNMLKTKVYQFKQDTNESLKKYLESI
jgi:hypothetical protein